MEKWLIDCKQFDFAAVLSEYQAKTMAHNFQHDACKIKYGRFIIYNSTFLKKMFEDKAIYHAKRNKNWNLKIWKFQSKLYNS